MRRIDANTGLPITDKFDAARIIGIDAKGYTFAVSKDDEPGHELVGGKIGDHVQMPWETPAQAAIREACEEAFNATLTTLSITHDISNATTFFEHRRTAIPLFPATVIDRGLRRIHIYFFFTEEIETLPFLREVPVGGERLTIGSIASFFGVRDWRILLNTPLCALKEKEVEKRWPKTTFQTSHAYYFWAALRDIVAQRFDVKKITSQ